jgi:hypothetical protein
MDGLGTVWARLPPGWMGWMGLELVWTGLDGVGVGLGLTECF